jgi:hypothetical protein
VLKKTLLLFLLPAILLNLVACSELNLDFEDLSAQNKKRTISAKERAAYLAKKNRAKLEHINAPIESTLLKSVVLLIKNLIGVLILKNILNGEARLNHTVVILPKRLPYVMGKAELALLLVAYQVPL